MTETNPKNVSERDQLMTRPTPEPLPTVQDPKAPRGEPADPKTNPKVRNTNDVDYTS